LDGKIKNVGTYERQKRCMHSFGGETWVEREKLEDVGVDWMVILKIYI
jgi:hypothetical protein